MTAVGYDSAIETTGALNLVWMTAYFLFDLSFSGRDLDAIARQYLWDVGLDYFHPTGYGVGQYLTAHEGI